MIRSPAEYVKECEAAFAACVMLPRPDSHEELQALDRAHPPNERRAGWADAFAGFVPDEWYSHRPPPPAEPEPEPELMDDDDRQKLVNTLATDPELREAFQAILRGAV